MIINNRYELFTSEQKSNRLYNLLKDFDFQVKISEIAISFKQNLLSNIYITFHN